MSERYGPCNSCHGSGLRSDHNCGACGGTGFSGDAMIYYEKQFERDRQIEREEMDRYLDKSEWFNGEKK